MRRKLDNKILSEYFGGLKENQYLTLSFKNLLFYLSHYLTPFTPVLLDLANVYFNATKFKIKKKKNILSLNPLPPDKIHTFVGVLMPPSLLPITLEQCPGVKLYDPCSSCPVHETFYHSFNKLPLFNKYFLCYFN